MCVGEQTAMMGSQLLLRARSPRSSLLPRSCDKDRAYSVRTVTYWTHPTCGGLFGCTWWTCVSGLAVAQISQPGREGLLMKVQEGQAHSVCWEEMCICSIMAALNVTSDQQQWQIHPNSCHTNELTYLHFTSLVAVIAQVEILHVGQIFDVTLSVASSPCAPWSRQTQKISVAEPTTTQHSHSCPHRVLSGIPSGNKRN